MDRKVARQAANPAGRRWREAGFVPSAGASGHGGFRPPDRVDEGGIHEDWRCRNDNGEQSDEVGPLSYGDNIYHIEHSRNLGFYILGGEPSTGGWEVVRYSVSSPFFGGALRRRVALRGCCRYGADIWPASSQLHVPPFGLSTWFEATFGGGGILHTAALNGQPTRGGVVAA